MITTVRLILFFLLLSLGADAQIIRANAFYIPTTTKFLLDAYPNAAAAYSLRKLKASYSGSAIRIRRDSTGNAETDIGFTVNGDLDTTAIKNHCRNNSCMVTTWYNQGDSTSRLNLRQTTAANQPRIVNAGVIERQNGEPYIRMVDANDNLNIGFNLQLTNQSYFSVTRTNQDYTNSTTQGTIWTEDTTINTRIGFNQFALGIATGTLTNERLSWLTSATSGTAFIQGVGQTTTNINTGNYLWSSFYTTSPSRSIFQNSTSLSLTNTTGGNFNNTTAYPRVWKYLGYSTASINGGFWEFILYLSDQSSNRTGIETNINNYYGLW